MFGKFTKAALVIGALMTASASEAGVNLVTNGNFETTTLTQSQQFNGNQVAGWTNATTSGYTGYGYNFLIQAGTADTTGFYSLGGNHDYLWGPNAAANAANYSNNGLTATSPTGGNYLIADGDANFHGAISQSISNLIIGASYQLSFYWGAAQFAGYNAATTERWDVTFGNSTFSTNTVNTAAKGYSPWTQVFTNFTATSTTQSLSFLAQGSPNGAPPTLLLDGVSLSTVPESSTWAMLIVGFGAIGYALRRERSNARAGAVRTR